MPRPDHPRASLPIDTPATSPIVWNFTGHLDRVGNVVVSGYKLGGVVGIDADKVTFLEGRDCIARAYDFASVDGVRATGQVHSLLGAEVAAGGTYGLGEIAIPSMIDDATNESSGQDRRAVTVDPATVVAITKVSTFEVLPGHAGIRQLLDNGSLEAVGGGYRILKPIAHYPAGLHGGYSVQFILGKGVPKPGGDPGHSCVISEEDGSVVAGSARCYASPIPELEGAHCRLADTDPISDVRTASRSLQNQPFRRGDRLAGVLGCDD